MTSKNILLSIIELGGYPDFTELYTKLGYEVVKANSMRKALSTIKKRRPDVIVAEFIYGPTYGSQLSNFESLFASLQRDAPHAKLVALLNKDDAQHLDRLKTRFPVYAQMFFPINTKKLQKILDPSY